MIRHVTMWGGPGCLDPLLFPKKDKSALFLLIRSAHTYINLESNEIGKTSVIILPFLNLNDIIQT